MLWFLAALFALMAAFTWWRISMQTWLGVGVVVFIAGLFIDSGVGVALSALFALVFAALLVVLYFAPKLRRKWISAPALAMVREAMPPISDTERDAIEAGTVWWDAQLFSGAPDWDALLNAPKPRLSDAEQAFLDGPVEEVCAMVDDWQVTGALNDLPLQVWEFIKRERFFGMNASAEYGGLEFSAYAQSCIVQKLATHSATLAVTVMVPNSLGPAELLEHYGTDEQKQRYLPRLARGEETPCFGLTNPWAGSDASGMPDCGVVCRATHDGEETLGFRINWEKRYITLGPVATLIGLAFRAHDPERLLGDETDLGITCALIPSDTAGIEIGARHLPLNAAFQNGPNRGRDVFIPMDWVIGGREQVGNGWRMLMECLAAGRGVSLPAAAAGAAKIAARSSGAYANVREQFGVEIAKFEGVEEALARIGGLTYLIDSARMLMAVALDAGEKPAVLSAIVKQQCTDLSRIAVNDAMDIHGGKGICMGPRNYLARTYQQIPIGITVEGANILTRSLIIFGQGALRCHPHLLEEINAAQMARDGDADSDDAALEQFDCALRQHIVHIIANKIRSTACGLTRGRLARGVGGGIVRRHSRAITHLSASFAFLADITLALLGGELKRREMLSGRFADALSNLYLASAALKRFRDDGEPQEDAPLADWACRYALHHAQQALDGILRNYPSRMLGRAMRINVFGAGRYLHPPDDALTRRAAAAMQTDGEARDRLTAQMYLSANPSTPLSQLEIAFTLMTQSKPLRRRLKSEGHALGAMQSHAMWLAGLRSARVIDDEESDLLARTRAAVLEAISVDAFDSHHLSRD